MKATDSIRNTAKMNIEIRKQNLLTKTEIERNNYLNFDMREHYTLKDMLQSKENITVLEWSFLSLLKRFPEKREEKLLTRLNWLMFPLRIKVLLLQLYSLFRRERTFIHNWFYTEIIRKSGNV